MSAVHSWHLHSAYSAVLVGLRTAAVLLCCRINYCSLRLRDAHYWNRVRNVIMRPGICLIHLCFRWKIVYYLRCFIGVHQNHFICHLVCSADLPPYTHISVLLLANLTCDAVNVKNMTAITGRKSFFAIQKVKSQYTRSFLDPYPVRASHVWTRYSNCCMAAPGEYFRTNVTTTC